MGLLLSAEHPECDGLVPCDSGSGDGGVKDTGGGTDRAYREIVKMFWDHLAVRGWPGPCSVSSRYTPGRRSVARISSCAAQDRMGLLFQPSLRIRRDPPDPVDLKGDRGVGDGQVVVPVAVFVQQHVPVLGDLPLQDLGEELAHLHLPEEETGNSLQSPKVRSR